MMRYTLRLLTSQQFQRATAMVCAAELRRRADEATWGSEPFRIGLWVGTEVSPKRFEEADAQLKNVNDGRSYRLTVRQIQRCPWCGTRVEPANIRADPGLRRVFVFCGDPLAECPFAEGGSAEEGLPVLTVDEEIYRLAPAFVIATVDKFARLAREGEAAALFGYVRRRCDRHGELAGSPTPGAHHRQPASDRDRRAGDDRRRRHPGRDIALRVPHRRSERRDAHALDDGERGRPGLQGAGRGRHPHDAGVGRPGAELTIETPLRRIAPRLVAFRVRTDA